MDHYEQDRVMARRIAELAAAQGGRAYYVGGYVRDGRLHRENKDIDMEIHGRHPARVEQLLEKVPADQVTAVVRTPEKAADLAARGVRIAVADDNPTPAINAGIAAGITLLLGATAAPFILRRHKKNATA